MTNNGYFFETYMIALKVNDRLYSFGRLVIDHFKCPEHGWFTKFHCFFDKETIEDGVITAREDNPDAKKGKIVIIYPYDGGEYHLWLGEYKLGKVGFNYKVDVNEEWLEEATQTIEETMKDAEFKEAGYED